MKDKEYYCDSKQMDGWSTILQDDLHGNPYLILADLQSMIV